MHSSQFGRSKTIYSRQQFLIHTFDESSWVAKSLYTDRGQSCVYNRIHSCGVLLKFYSSVIRNEARPTFLPPGNWTYWTKPLSMDSFTGRLDYKPLWTSLNLYGLIQTSWPELGQLGKFLVVGWAPKGPPKGTVFPPTYNHIFKWSKSVNLAPGMSNETNDRIWNIRNEIMNWWKGEWISDTNFK